MVTKSEIRSYITQAAIARGIDPAVALSIATHEGLGAGSKISDGLQSNVTKQGVRETSYGPYQLKVGGGLGDIFKQTTGLDPADINTYKAQVDFALNYAAQNGWGSWYGRGPAGISIKQGLANAKVIPIGTALASTVPPNPTARPPMNVAANPATGSAAILDLLGKNGQVDPNLLGYNATNKSVTPGTPAAVQDKMQQMRTDQENRVLGQMVADGGLSYAANMLPDLTKVLDSNWPGTVSSALTPVTTPVASQPETIRTPGVGTTAVKTLSPGQVAAFPDLSGAIQPNTVKTQTITAKPNVVNGNGPILVQTQPVTTPPTGTMLADNSGTFVFSGSSPSDAAANNPGVTAGVKSSGTLVNPYAAASTFMSPEFLGTSLPNAGALTLAPTPAEKSAMAVQSMSPPSLWMPGPVPNTVTGQYVDPVAAVYGGNPLTAPATGVFPNVVAPGTPPGAVPAPTLAPSVATPAVVASPKAVAPAATSPSAKSPSATTATNPVNDLLTSFGKAVASLFGVSFGANGTVSMASGIPGVSIPLVGTAAAPGLFTNYGAGVTLGPNGTNGSSYSKFTPSGVGYNMSPDPNGGTTVSTQYGYSYNIGSPSASNPTGMTTYNL